MRPYSEEVREDDTRAAKETVQARLYPSEDQPFAIDFGGTCPRCDHAISDRKVLVGILGAGRMNARKRRHHLADLKRRGDLSEGDHTFDLICSCTAAHTNRPPEKVGCGARFRVRAQWP